MKNTDTDYRYGAAVKSIAASLESEMIISTN